METTKKKKAKGEKSSSVSGEMIVSAYREYLLTKGVQPPSVFSFCKDHGIAEDVFYAFFASFDALEKSIWTSYVLETKSRLEGDSNYAGFSAREKLLAFCFSLVELLKRDRSFVLLTFNRWKNPVLMPAFLSGFKAAYMEWIVSILNEGKQSGEVAHRPVLDTRYGNIFWLHLLFILQFWCKDESAGFEKTDVAIEKSVNLAFELIGKGVLDNALDFGKFLYQHVRSH